MRDLRRTVLALTFCALLAAVPVRAASVTDNANALFPSGAILSRGNTTLEGNGSDNAFTGTYSSK